MLNYTVQELKSDPVIQKIKETILKAKIYSVTEPVLNSAFRSRKPQNVVREIVMVDQGVDLVFPLKKFDLQQRNFLKLGKRRFDQDLCGISSFSNH